MMSEAYKKIRAKKALRDRDNKAVKRQNAGVIRELRRKGLKTEVIAKQLGRSVATILKYEKEDPYSALNRELRRKRDLGI